MYSRNVQEMLQHLVDEGQLKVDFEDEITKECCVTHDGEIAQERVREAVGAAS
jgi:NAD(P) transhydrogenase subunit alpha